MASLVASLHYVAIGIGFSGLLLRQKALKDLFESPKLKPVFFGDNLWGLSGLLFLGTGLFRAFGGLEKGSSFYLHNHWFHVKIGLFLTIFLLEILPMVVLIKWRLSQKSSVENSDHPIIRRISLLSRLELVVLLLMPFVASMMARGLWM